MDQQLGWLNSAGATANASIVGPASPLFPAWIPSLLAGRHVDPTTPFQWDNATITSGVVAFMLAVLANSAGVGGGAFYIPLFHVVLGFKLKPAMALSTTVVAFSAIGSTSYGLWQTSPRDPNYTLIDFDLAACLIPALLAGVTFGVLLNVFVPEWLQTVVLVIVFCFVIRATAEKGRRQWEAEQRLRKPPARSQSIATSRPGKGYHVSIPEDEEVHAGVSREEPVSTVRQSNGQTHEGAESLSVPLIEAEGDVDGDGWESDHEVIVHEESVHRVSRRELMRHRSFIEEVKDYGEEIHSAGAQLPASIRRLPFLKIAGIVVLWWLFLISQELKSQYARCSWQNTLLLVSQLTVLGVATLGATWLQVQKAKRTPDQLGPELRRMLVDDMGQTKPSVGPIFGTLVGVIAIAGLIAGFLGIGGALVFNPFLLEAGIHPQVTASTAILMVLFSTSAVSLSLAYHGFLNYNYATVFAPICFVGAISGVTLIGRIVRRSGRASIIIFILLGLLIVGTCFTAIVGGIATFEDIKKGQDLDFHHFCGK